MSICTLPVSVTKRAKARVVSGSRGRTYEYPWHIALLTLVKQWMVPEGTHVALPGRWLTLSSVDIAVKVA